MASAHLYQRDFARSLAELKKLRLANNDSSHAYLLVAMAIANADQGNQAEARSELDELIALSNRSLVSPYELSEVYSHLGDRDQALARLSEALDHHSYDLVYLANDPDFDQLRSDARFEEIEGRLRYPDSALNASSRQYPPQNH